MTSTILIGTGRMSREYAKVLNSINEDFEVIGRTIDSCEKFAKDTGISAHSGGVEAYFKSSSTVPTNAIIAINVEALYEHCHTLLNLGVKNILVEKPGALSIEELNTLKELADAKNAAIKIAYNRRFYEAITHLKNCILSDGGARSVRCELTEWGHLIDKTKTPSQVLEKWFLANTTHVLDTAFFIAGKPQELHCYQSKPISWHPTGSVFAGSGILDSGALFSYQADWSSAGRWSIEVTTSKRKYVLAPMEKLQSIEIGTVKLESTDIDYEIDNQFKPGLYRQVEAFIANSFEHHCDISEHLTNMPFYNKIAGYQE